MKIPCNLWLMSTVIHPGITSHSTASSHPPFSVGWVSSYLGGFPLGRFLGSVFSSPSLPLSCCGKACSRIVSCRVYDARLGQMDRFACYQVVGVFDGCRGDSSLQPVLAFHPCAFQFAPALWLMKFQCSLI